MLTVSLARRGTEIIEKAGELGQDTERYPGGLAYEALHQPGPDAVRSSLTPMEQAYAFRRWAADPPCQLGPYSETAHRREDIDALFR